MLVSHKRSTWLVLFLLCMTLAIGGCSRFKKLLPASLSKEDDNAEKPAQLMEFKPTLELTRVWARDVGGGTRGKLVKLSPAAAGNKVFAADQKGLVTAVDLETGKIAWEAKIGDTIASGVGAGDDVVLVGTGEGEVFALAQTTGKVVWNTRVSTEVLAAPSIQEGVAVVRTNDGKLFGFEAGSGNRLWVYDRYDRQAPLLTLRGTSSPLIKNGMVIAGFDSGSLVALELRNGRVAWEANVAQSRGRTEIERLVDIDAEPVIYHDTLYAVTYQGRVAALAVDSGRLLWEKGVSSYAGLGADARYVYLTDEHSTVFSLDRDTGNPVWNQNKLYDRGATAPASVGTYVVVGDNEGYLHWLRREDGEFAARVEVDSDPIISPLLVIDETVVAYTAGGTLSAYRAK